MTTGECTETMSAVQVLEAVKFRLATIVSEKKVGGKVTQLTFSYQGQRGTIYRERVMCEAVARATHKKKTKSHRSTSKGLVSWLFRYWRFQNLCVNFKRVLAEYLLVQYSLGRVATGSWLIREFRSGSLVFFLFWYLTD
jgi:hypothetical protein